MFKQLLCQIFSGECQLASVEFDITKSFYSIHQSLKTDSHFPSNTICKSCCLTLRRLCIYIDHKCFLEHLVEYTPNLEQLSVHFQHSLINDDFLDSDTQTLIMSDGNWFNKVRSLCNHNITLLLNVNISSYKDFFERHDAKNVIDEKK